MCKKALDTGLWMGPGFNQSSLTSSEIQMFQVPLDIDPLTNPKLSITAARLPVKYERYEECNLSGS